jgi:hypothetical protein
MAMEKNSISRKKVMQSRKERLKIALKANMAKRKVQADARASNLTKDKSIEFKLED